MIPLRTGSESRKRVVTVHAKFSSGGTDPKPFCSRHCDSDGCYIENGVAPLNRSNMLRPVRHLQQKINSLPWIAVRV